MSHRILVVEDEQSLARVLTEELTLEGFEVRSAGDGSTAFDIANKFPPDLVLLDVMLPGTKGFDLCQVWQSRGVPVIFLTARGQKHDKVRGFQAGADDYVTKPFEFEELLARIRVVLRRTKPDVNQLVLGTTTIDFHNHKAWNERGAIELTFKEFEVLRYLARRAKTVVLRDDLLREVWGYSGLANTRAVDHAIARLRRKIEPDPHHPRYIHTVRGDGYYLVPDGTQVAGAIV